MSSFSRFSILDLFELSFIHLMKGPFLLMASALLIPCTIAWMLRSIPADYTCPGFLMEVGVFVLLFSISFYFTGPSRNEQAALKVYSRKCLPIR